MVSRPPQTPILRVGQVSGLPISGPPDRMQCVILAGGLGTRMRPLTDTLPKTLLPVRGRPFAWYQLDWLARHGVTEVVYCIGHQGDKIRRYWETGPSPAAGLQWPALRFVDEGEQLRGTAGALRLALAEGVLDESFFVLYGDSFLPIDFAPIWSAFKSGCASALMTVLRNEGRWESSNVVYSNGLVTLYDKRSAHPEVHDEMIYVDYGLSAFRRAVIEQSTDADLSTLFHRLSVAGDLAGYEVTQRFYEIGSPQGLRDLELLLPSLP